MIAKLTNQNFIEKAKNIHNNKYDYSLVDYKNNTTKIKIICPIHGIFEQRPTNHLTGNGCPICANKIRNKDRILQTEEFVEKASVIHNNKYDYSKTQYGSNNLIYVTIICPIHGEFKQRPAHHLCGKGCIKCGRINISNAATKNSYGWSITNWKLKLENNKTAIPKLYVLKCFNENEVFIKVGVTIHDIKIRYIGKREMPYDYQVILEHKNNIENILKLELKIKKLFKQNKYTPKLSFSGITECYRIDIEKEILNFIQE